MPSEGTKKMNEMMRQGRRRYRLIVEDGRGRVVRIDLDPDADDDAFKDGERPGAERPIPPWAAVKRKRD